MSAVEPVDAGEHVVGAAFIGRTEAPVLALADGTLLFARPEERRIVAHPDGAVLTAVADRDRLVTGGDDGRVVAASPDGAVEEIGRSKGWIDALAVGGSGAVAWAAGRSVHARSTKGEVKSVEAPSSVRGLGFAPKGYRLAFSHYNGASLWFPNSVEAPETWSWKGSHLDAMMSPDGAYLVTTMQENAMHGWRLSDGRNMRMSGYPSKVRSTSWSPDGKWLATSGAEACVVWPFDGKDGPMGRTPRECGVRDARVSRVAFHPAALVLALGYEDGFVLLCRLSDGTEIPIRKADGPGGAISALAWDRQGRRLMFGTREGRAGLLSLPT